MRYLYSILTFCLLALNGCNARTKLYSWEKDEIRTIADAAICYGGHTARNPYLWTPERFEKTVLYTDEKGQQHWFFDNMIGNFYFDTASFFFL